MIPEEQAREDDYGYWDDLQRQRGFPSAYKCAVESVMKLRAALAERDWEIERLRQAVQFVVERCDQAFRVLGWAGPRPEMGEVWATCYAECTKALNAVEKTPSR